MKHVVPQTMQSFAACFALATHIRWRGQRLFLAEVDLPFHTSAASTVKAGLFAMPAALAADGCGYRTKLRALREWLRSPLRTEKFVCGLSPVLLQVPQSSPQNQLSRS